MKKSVLSVIVLLALVFVSISYATPIKAAEVSKIDEDALEIIILENFTWAKQGNQILLNENFLMGAGTTDGDWFPIAMERYGYEEETFGNYLDAIEQDITEKYATSALLDRNKTTEWHRIALAVTAMGADPTSIGQDLNANPVNLIADGIYNPKNASGQVERQGINGPIWALIALDSKNYDVPANASYQRDDLIALILERQLADGGFALSGDSSDPDITAMALQALAPYENSEKTYTAYGGAQKTAGQVIAEALNVMGTKQHSDGDFSSWGTMNAESTAQMLIALCSLGIDPYEDERFIKNGNTLIDGLLKYLMEDGGFAHSFTNDPQNPAAVAGKSDRMASEQAQLALLAYYRLINGMTRLYDFTDMNSGDTQPDDDEDDEPAAPENDGVFSHIPFITLSYDSQYVESEKYSVVFEEGKTQYVIDVPFGQENLMVESTPFTSSADTNLTRHTEIIPNTVNNFYYVNEDGGRISFTISTKTNFFAAADSLVLEAAHLESMEVTQQNKHAVYDAMKALQERYDNLDFSYEKTYTYLHINFHNSIYNIIEKLQAAGMPTEGETPNASDALNELLREKEELEYRLKDLPGKADIEMDELSSVELLSKKLEDLQAELERFISGTSGEEKSLAQDALLDTKLLSDEVAGLLQELQNRQQQIFNLDEAIEKYINHQTSPLTLQNKSTVSELMGMYEDIPTHSRNLLINEESLLLADAIMQSLQEGVVPKELFEQIQGQQVQYELVGDEDFYYSIVFDGRNIDRPCDMAVGMYGSSSSRSDIERIANEVSEYFVFAQEGELPGYATVTVETQLSNGVHKLYYFDGGDAQLVGEVEVVGGKLSFGTYEGGEYFVAESLKTPTSTTVIPRPTSSSDITARTTTVITTESYNGTIPKEAFEKIAGIDENVKGIGRIDDTSKQVTFIFNGEDVTNPTDFDAGITTQGENVQNILRLSPEALPISLEQEGTLPGVALLEFESELADGEYILFKYNEQEMRAEVVEKIGVTEGVVRFIVSENADYFIAKSASLDSLATLPSDALNAEGEQTPLAAAAFLEQMPLASALSTALEGTPFAGFLQGANAFFDGGGIVVVTLAIILLSAGTAVFLISYQKKKARKKAYAHEILSDEPSGEEEEQSLQEEQTNTLFDESVPKKNNTRPFAKIIAKLFEEDEKM